MDHLTLTKNLDRYHVFRAMYLHKEPPCFKYGMTICYLSSPHQHKWDMEILDGSVLIRASVFESLQPVMGRPQGAS